MHSSIITILNILLLVSLLVAVQGKVTSRECSGIVIDGREQETEILKNDISGPYMLAIDYNSNYIFFSYSTKERVGFQSAYIKLKSNKFVNLSGVTSGFANAVDDQHMKVYIGGEGIYEFNYETNSATQISDKGENIWNMFYKDVLYYTTFPEEKLFSFKDGESRLVEELKDTKVSILAIDKNNVMFITNSSGLYSYGKNDSTSKFYGNYDINGMTTNNQGEVYFSTIDAIYRILDGGVKKISDLSNHTFIYGLAIDADDTIIYSDTNSIVRLKPSKTKCFIRENIHDSKKS